MGEEDSLQWILSDHLSSASVTANADGTWNSSIQYTAFGEIRAASGLTATKYRYTGQLAQDVLGLDYYVARFYDPATSHFVSADTIIPEPTRIISYNRYSYSNDNPQKYLDPNGHHPILVFLAIAIWFILEVPSDTYSPDRQIPESNKALGNTLLRTIDPVDWIMTGDDCLQGKCSTLDIALSIIPFLNGSIDNVVKLGNNSDELIDLKKIADDLPDDALVCRGGLCNADSFSKGSGVTLNPDGSLKGISVQSAANVTLDELAIHIPNNQIGVTTVKDIKAAGGQVFLDPRPGNPYHAQLSGVTSDIAQNLFQPTIRNPLAKIDRLR